MIDVLVNVAVAIEAVAAVALVVLAFREFRFLGTLRPFLPKNEYLPLFGALINRAAVITGIGAYLLVLTVVGAVLAALELPSLAEVFPPIRAINGGLFLILLSGPIYYGRALRSITPPQE